MDPKGFEKKPWFPYVKNMYDQIGEDIMSVDVKGYEEKPWWPYVLDLQEKIDAGGGGSSDFSTAEVTVTVDDTQTAGDYSYPSITMIIFYDSAYEITEMSLGQLTSTATVLLYKGAYFIPANDDEGSDNGIVGISGAVEKTTFEDFSMYKITGNCAFVVKPYQMT